MKKDRAPYKVLFSNDTTNVLSCESPFHKRGEPLRDEKIEASVDETVGTGVDVHMLQPGVGWIPWWKSASYPAEEHYRWFMERTGRKTDLYGDYMLVGGDVVEVFVKRCRKKGIAPFISCRLNDGHHLEHVDSKDSGSVWSSRFYAEHPEYRIGPSLRTWYDRVHNWAIPEVRAHKFAFISEICENYDIDGLELDYMRHPSYFQLDRTSSEERAEIMTDFITQVRDLLDRTAGPGQRRWLCVRVPCYTSAYDALGIDLPAMVEAGVDMVNLSASYFTEQQTDLPAVRRTIPDAAVYLELCHCTALGVRVSKTGYDSYLFRRTTDHQYYTAAHLAYARGADGVSAFNFVYYREHGAPGRGPFHEPPFHVFSHLGDPQWLACQPQHYFLDKGWESRYLTDRPIPKKLAPGQSAAFMLDMAPPQGGWKKDGRLRIQGAGSVAASKCTAQFNGVALKPDSDVSEPYPGPYPSLLGKPEELRAWTVPVGQVKDGANSIEISIAEGEPTEITYLDLAIE